MPMNKQHMLLLVTTSRLQLKQTLGPCAGRRCEEDFDDVEDLDDSDAEGQQIMQELLVQMDEDLDEADAEDMWDEVDDEDMEVHKPSLTLP